MNINELIAQLEGRRLEFKGELPTNVGDNVGDVGDVGNIDNNISYNKLKIIQLILHNPNITTKEIAETLGISTRQCERIIAKLKQSGKLLRKGSARTGYWEINNN
nr:winged helix-turn-helix transcriptional regulator [Bacteroides intestinalis]